MPIEWGPNPVIIEIGSFALRYYSLLFAGGLFLGYSVVANLYKDTKRNLDELDSLAVLIFIATVLGARLGHCLFYEPEYYLSHPLQMLLPFRQENGAWVFTGYQGLASHGGIAAVLLAIIYWCRKNKRDIFQILDFIVIGGSLTGCFIRLGNFMNSEILGKPTGSDVGVIFTKVDSIVRHPAQLYEAIAYFLTFAILLFTYKKRPKDKKHGFILAVYLILLFGARFIIEYFKIEQVAFEQGMVLNMGQILSIPFILAGLVLVFLRK